MFWCGCLYHKRDCCLIFFTGGHFHDSGSVVKNGVVVVAGEKYLIYLSIVSRVLWWCLLFAAALLSEMCTVYLLRWSSDQEILFVCALQGIIWSGICAYQALFVFSASFHVGRPPIDVKRRFSDNFDHLA